MKEEKEAFIESLYLQYAGKLERASLNYVRHRGEYRDLVDDSIQKTFLKAYEEYDTLKDAPYIEAWLFKVCRYRLMTALNTYRRRQKRHVPLEDDAALTERELPALLDVQKFIGLAPEQTREFLRDVVRPVIEKRRDLIGAAAGRKITC